MKMNRQLQKKLSNARKTVYRASKKAKGMSKAALAGAAGVALMLGNMGKTFRDKASDWTSMLPSKKSSRSREVVTVRKSTVIALLVALAAVAGVLGALYVYVLRREKELDEYEQLLFGEEFDDDDGMMQEMEESASEAPAKAAQAEG